MERSSRDPRAPISRRALLHGGLYGAAGLLLAETPGLARLEIAPAAKARAVIQIWMWGGPSHLDTFDPKPGAGRDYCGPLGKPIATNVDGVVIGELLPELATQADKYALVRSMTHDQNAHETASYMVQTGWPSDDGLVHPCLGAVVSRARRLDGDVEGLIPPYIVLTEPHGRFSEAGFLGPRHKPFATGGNPAQKRFLVEGVVVEGISDERQAARRELLRRLDALRRSARGDPRLAEWARCEDEAYELILGQAGRVFDLSEEPDESRERYGKNTFGQSCLMARRLVEQGVPYVTINYKGWDTHKQHFQVARRKLPEMDRGVAMLLRDLDQRGLLESTIVWWSGEFGRTPRIQWDPPFNGGRGHHSRVFSALVAGGGFRGGCVVGASDERGEEVEERPVYPWDLIGSMYGLLGIDPEATLRHPRGQSVPIMPRATDGIPSGGLLREIT